MSEESKRGDFYSGIPWVYVTPDQARGHPKGQLGPALWAIVAYFIIAAIVKTILSINYGLGVSGAAVNGLWPLIVGLGLALRIPWAVIFAAISAGLTVYALVRGLGGDGSLVTLLELVINIGVLFYLIDADRPNLIYRHRYRKYSVVDGGPDA